MACAIELLKAYGTAVLPSMPTVDKLVGAWLADKEFSVEAVRGLTQARMFGPLVDRYVFGVSGDTEEERRSVVTYMGRSAVPQRVTGLENYVGENGQNAAIDHALSEAQRQTQTVFKSSACNRWVAYSGITATKQGTTTPIAIVGGGAAAILLSNALFNLGFSKITVYEKSKALGIWAYSNVADGSRNNPLNLRFRETELPAAPGDGKHVVDFLKSNILGNLFQAGTEVDRVEPGVNFNHKVVTRGKTEDQNTETIYPIVINCTGLGKPRPLSDPSRMKTAMTATQAGERWQRKLVAKECRGKRFCFIGLGNSTAEMLRQMHTMQDLGVDVDYRILTHFPEEAVFFPETQVRHYRVFRDTSIPNLTSWQGDLPDSRYDYFRALRTDKIISNVTSWARTEGFVGYQQNKNGFKHGSVRTEKLFTLIGYEHSAADLQTKWGITSDHQGPKLDYDGEVQRRDGNTNDRLYKGYFAFGAVAANKRNQNSIVIPGMLFRLHDLVASVILRASEYALASEN